MRVAGMFAGIGGLEVGLACAGHRAELFGETSPAARAVLAARFPGVPCESDIRALASPPAILMPDGAVITPDIRDAERPQGFPADWTLPAAALVVDKVRQLPRGLM